MHVAQPPQFQYHTNKNWPKGLFIVWGNSIFWVVELKLGCEGFFILIPCGKSLIYALPDKMALLYPFYGIFFQGSAHGIITQFLFGMGIFFSNTCGWGSKSHAGSDRFPVGCHSNKLHLLRVGFHFLLLLSALFYLQGETLALRPSLLSSGPHKYIYYLVETGDSFCLDRQCSLFSRFAGFFLFSTKR